MNAKILKHSSLFLGYILGTIYRNLATFLKFWSYFDYWKFQKALAFSSTFNFLNIVFWLYIASKKRASWEEFS
jgi:hypothetical protein